MPEALQKKLEYEIQQIDRLQESFQPLMDVVTVREPDLIELSALATVLHSFYGGVENIFVTIAKNTDGKLPTGTKWHKDLLDQMSRATTNRSAVVNDRLHSELMGFLSFRHFFRNSYAFQLDWEQMGPLIRALPGTWNELKRCFAELISVFIEDADDA